VRGERERERDSERERERESIFIVPTMIFLSIVMEDFGILLHCWKVTLFLL
jgi:hypothetical protein